MRQGWNRHVIERKNYMDCRMNSDRILRDPSLGTRSLRSTNCPWSGPCPLLKRSPGKNSAPIGCPRSIKYRLLCQPVIGSYGVTQKEIQRSQRNVRQSIHVQSLAERHQSLTSLICHTDVKLIWNSISSSRVATGTNCSASQSISSCVNYTVIMHSLTRKRALGVDSSSRAGSMLKTQEGLANPQFRYSASNSEIIKSNTTSMCSKHSQSHANSYTNHILHHDRSTGTEIPSLPMSAPPAVGRSKAARAQQALLLLATLRTT
jgi:hypothetical protein